MITDDSALTTADIDDGAVKRASLDDCIDRYSDDAAHAAGFSVEAACHVDVINRTLRVARLVSAVSGNDCARLGPAAGSSVHIRILEIHVVYTSAEETEETAV